MGCDEAGCNKSEVDGICRNCGELFRLCITHLRDHQKKKHNIVLLSPEELKNKIKLYAAIDLQKNFLNNLKEIKYKIIKHTKIIINRIKNTTKLMLQRISHIKKKFVVSNNQETEIEYDLIINQILIEFQNYDLCKKDLNFQNNVLSDAIDIKDITNIFSETVFKYVDFINNNRLENLNLTSSERVYQKSKEILHTFLNFKTSNEIETLINIYINNNPKFFIYVDTDNQSKNIRMCDYIERINIGLKFIKKSAFIIQNIATHINSRENLKISIYKGILCENSTQSKVCVKTFKILNKSIKYNKEIINEIKIYHMLSDLSSPDNCFLKYYGSSIDEHNSISIYMDCFEYNLMDYINYLEASRYIFSENLFVSIAYKLLDSYSMMATLGIFHNDIKPHNLLIDNQWNIKIIDFDVSVIVDENMSDSMNQRYKIQGTDGYLAPEKKKALNSGQSEAYFDIEKSDVYSLGLVFYQLLFYKKVEYLKTKDLHSDIDKLIGFSKDAKFFLKYMLEEDPSRRASFNEAILWCPFYKRTNSF